MVWGLAQRAIPAQALIETCEFPRLKGRDRDDRRVLARASACSAGAGSSRKANSSLPTRASSTRWVNRRFRDDPAETGSGLD